eukprot:CAMPEP_0174275744 /NCGR_PEP_ID=MMETSP0439-20130205/59996_1 /TAXON_ID=0 /ORGANISM="Stereomyxa ramosa, Strain Chinc5" /LENGTH=351 /DNA_ID=CAMNT_0015367885 /DNA_START=458 /DNA_END=1513 /DNA_ORIENTATION=+
MSNVLGLVVVVFVLGASGTTFLGEPLSTDRALKDSECHAKDYPVHIINSFPFTNYAKVDGIPMNGVCLPIHIHSEAFAMWGIITLPAANALVNGIPQNYQPINNGNDAFLVMMFEHIFPTANSESLYATNASYSLSFHIVVAERSDNLKMEDVNSEHLLKFLGSKGVGLASVFGVTDNQFGCLIGRKLYSLPHDVAKFSVSLENNVIHCNVYDPADPDPIIRLDIAIDDFSDETSGSALADEDNFIPVITTFGMGNNVYPIKRFKTRQTTDSMQHKFWGANRDKLEIESTRSAVLEAIGKGDIQLARATHLPNLWTVLPASIDATYQTRGLKSDELSSTPSVQNDVLSRMW